MTWNMTTSSVADCTDDDTVSGLDLHGLTHVLG